MSEVNFIVRDSKRTISSVWHGSCADRAVAALSADPETLDELDVAIDRFMNPRSERWFRYFLGSLDDRPYDAGLVIIDLAARLVVVDSSYSLPGLDDVVYYHDGKCATDVPIRYRLSDEWRITTDAESWRSLAKARRQERAARPPLDARAVLYGRPLVEFVASECYTAFARRDEHAEATRRTWIADRKKRAERWPESEAAEETSPRDPEWMTLEELAPSTWPGQEHYASPFYNVLKEIHAAWLMTPRADLRGEIPREILLAQRDHISRDLESRSMQWSRLNFCPRGLATTSHAFRFGGFGTHELVMYYDLVRKLLWSCWEQLTEVAEWSDPRLRPYESCRSDFLSTEVERLEHVRDTWLNTPIPEHHFRTPQSIIDRERQRIPEAGSGNEAMVDPDCPCCQKMADTPGPIFWNLDGSAMDEGFAFSIYFRTREEWDAEQRDVEEFSRKCDAREVECRRLGVHDWDAEVRRGDSVWSKCFSIADTPDVPLGRRLFRIGSYIAELIVDLREPPRRSASRDSNGTTSQTELHVDPQPHIDKINRHFGELRDVLFGGDSIVTESLITPVLERFSETLRSMSVDRPDLAANCKAMDKFVKSFLSPDPCPREILLDEEVPF